MIVTRTRAFGIIVIIAQSEFNLVGSPLYGGALERLRRTVRAKRARAAGNVPSGSRVA
jgi:hypothetical protein